MMSTTTSSSISVKPPFFLRTLRIPFFICVSPFLLRNEVRHALRVVACHPRSGAGLDVVRQIVGAGQGRGLVAGEDELPGLGAGAAGGERGHRGEVLQRRGIVVEPGAGGDGGVAVDAVLGPV